MAGVASTNGKVASGLLRWKITSRSFGAWTRSRLPSRPAGPPLTLILRIRSNEYFTARASSASPLENFRPSRSRQRYTWFEESLKPQLSAASGWGSLAPVG
ncbi:hypothetical protein SAFG77S_02764 [Streptomyces afghaniensis]